MKAGVIITGSEVYCGRIQDRFEPVIRGKMERCPAEIVGVPGAAISLSTTIFDVLLPHIFTGDKPTKTDPIHLGNGGLCQMCKACRWPSRTFGRY